MARDFSQNPLRLCEVQLWLKVLHLTLHLGDERKRSRIAGFTISLNPKPRKNLGLVLPGSGISDALLTTQHEEIKCPNASFYAGFGDVIVISKLEGLTAWHF